MRKIRGFLLKHRVTRFTKFFRFFLRRHRSEAAYRLLDPIREPDPKPSSKLFSWGHRLKTKAKAICGSNPRPGYQPIGSDLVKEKFGSVPRGQMAVYVGQTDGDYRRELVPVIYFNHPLFGQLLREAEEKYGFNHPGGITIPCRISEFERVKTRIKAGCTSGGRKMLTSK